MVTPRSAGHKHRVTHGVPHSVYWTASVLRPLLTADWKMRERKWDWGRGEGGYIRQRSET